MLCPVLNSKIVQINVELTPGVSKYLSLTDEIISEIEVVVYMCSGMPGHISYESDTINKASLPSSLWNASDKEIESWLKSMGLTHDGDTIVVPVLRADSESEAVDLVSCFWGAAELSWIRDFSKDIKDDLNPYIIFSWSNPQDNCAECHWINTTISAITTGDVDEVFPSPRIPSITSVSRDMTPKNIPFTDEKKDYFLGELPPISEYAEWRPNMVPGEKIVCYWSMLFPKGIQTSPVGSVWFHTPLFTGGRVVKKTVNPDDKTQVLYSVQVQGVLVENIIPTDFAPYFEYGLNDWVYLVKMDNIRVVTFAGFDDFKQKNPDFPLLYNEDKPINYTTELIAMLQSVNDTVNASTYRLDESQYGKLDNWAFMNPGGSGDCEDFALTKAKMLLDKGVSRDALHIEAGKNAKGQWHAWLEVSTTEGDFALNNDKGKVLKNSALPYAQRQRLVGGDWVLPLNSYSNLDGNIGVSSKLRIAPVYFSNGPTFNHFQTKNLDLSSKFQETFDLSCYEGVVTGVYTDENFADASVTLMGNGKKPETVDMSRIPIYYHCEDQGADYNIVKGWTAFSVGASVLVFNETGKKEGFTPQDFSIVGFKEQLKACASGQIVMFESRPNLSRSDYTTLPLGGAFRWDGTTWVSPTYETKWPDLTINDFNKPARLSTVKLLPSGATVLSTVTCPDNIEILSVRWSKIAKKYMVLYCYGPGYDAGNYYPEFTGGGITKYLGFIDPVSGVLGSRISWNTDEHDAVFICDFRSEGGKEYYMLARHPVVGTAHLSEPYIIRISYTKNEEGEDVFTHDATWATPGFSCVGEGSFIFTEGSADLGTLFSKLIHPFTTGILSISHPFWPYIDEVQMVQVGVNLVWVVSGRHPTHEYGAGGSSRGEVRIAPLDNLTNSTVIYTWNLGHSTEGNEQRIQRCMSLCYDPLNNQLILFFESQRTWIRHVDPFFWHCPPHQGPGYPNIVNPDGSFTVAEQSTFTGFPGWTNRRPHCMLYDPLQACSVEGGPVKCVVKASPLSWDANGNPVLTGTTFAGCFEHYDDGDGSVVIGGVIAFYRLCYWDLFPEFGHTRRDSGFRIGAKDHPYFVQTEEEKPGAEIGDALGEVGDTTPHLAQRIVMSLDGTVIHTDLSEIVDDFFVSNHYDPVAQRIVFAKAANY